MITNNGNPIELLLKLPIQNVISQIEKIDDLPFFNICDYISNNNHLILQKNKIHFINLLITLIEKYVHISKLLLNINNLNQNNILVVLIKLYINDINSNKLTQIQQSIIKLLSLIIQNNLISKSIYDFIYENISTYFRGNTISTVSLLNYFTLLKIIYNYGEQKNKQKLNTPKTFFYFTGKSKLAFTPHNFNKQFIMKNTQDYFQIITYIYIPSSQFKFKTKFNSKISLIKLIFDNDSSKQFEIFMNSNFNVNISYQNQQLFEINNNSYKLPTNKWIQLNFKQQTIRKQIFVYEQSISLNIVNINDNSENKIMDKILSNKLFKWETISYLECFTDFYGYAGTTLLISSFNEQLENGTYLTTKLIEEIIQKNRNLIKCVIDPNYYNDNNHIIQENISNLSIYFISDDYKYNGIIYKNTHFKSIANVGGITVFLPLMELILQCCKSTCEKEGSIILKEYFLLINNIVFKSKKNFNETHLNQNGLFFKCLCLLCESLPQKYYNNELFNLFMLLFYSYLNICNKLKLNSLNSKFKVLFKFVDFFILNEKIVSNFPFEKQISLYKIIIQSAINFKIGLSNIVSWNKLYSLLRIYDNNRYHEMCCVHHEKIFKCKTKSTKPNLMYKINYLLQMAQSLLQEEEYDLFSQGIHNGVKKQYTIISITKMLVMDLSPCLRLALLKLIINAIKNERNYSNMKGKPFSTVQVLLQSNIIEILCFSMNVSLIDAKKKALKILQIIYFDYEDLLTKYLVGINKTKNEFEKDLFTFMKYNLSFENKYLENNDMECLKEKINKKSEDNLCKLYKLNDIEYYKKMKVGTLEGECNFSNDIEIYWLNEGNIASAVETLSKHCVNFTRKMKTNSLVNFISANNDIKLKRFNKQTLPFTASTDPLNYKITFPVTSLKISITPKYRQTYNQNSELSTNNNVHEKLPNYTHKKNSIIKRTHSYTSDNNRNLNKFHQIKPKKYNKTNSLHNNKYINSNSNTCISSFNSSFLNHTSYQHNLKQLYNQLFISLNLPQVKSNKCLVTYTQDLLLYLTVFSKNINLINSYLRDANSFLNLNDISFHNSIVYFYKSPLFYQFLIETMFQCTIIINSINNINNFDYPNPFFILNYTKENFIINVNDIYYICRTIHKTIVFEKNHFNNETSLLIKKYNIKFKSLDYQKKMCSLRFYLDILFNFGIYIKNQYNGNICEIVDNFIKNLLLDGIEFYNYILHAALKETTQLNEYTMNFVEYINLAYEFIYFYREYFENQQKNDLKIIKTKCTLFSNCNLLNYIKTYFKKEISSKNKTHKSKWKDYTLFKLIIEGLSPIWSLNPKLKKQSSSKTYFFHMEGYNSFLDEKLFKVNTQIFNKEIELLTFIQNKNDKPLIKIINILFITALYLNQSETKDFEILQEYESFIIFLIIISTNYFQFQQQSQNEEIFELFKEELLFAFCFLFYCAYEQQEINRGKYQNTLSLITYIIGKIVLFNQNKDDQSFAFLKRNIFYHTPIMKLFREYFIIEEKETNVNGERKIMLNTILPIQDINIDTFQFINILSGFGSKREIINQTLLLNEQILFGKLNNYFNPENERNIFLKRKTESKKFRFVYNNEVDNIYIKRKNQIQRIVEKIILITKKNEQEYNDKIKKRQIKRMSLYKNVKQKLFMWNNSWNIKKLFYDNIHQIKQKRVNHYTYDFQMPLLCPIIDNIYYLPKFSGFNSAKLFLKNNKNLPYRIILDVKNIFTNENNMLSHPIVQTNQKSNDLLYIYKNCFDGKFWNYYSNYDMTKGTSNIKQYKCCLVKECNHLIGTIIHSPNDPARCKFILRKISSQEMKTDKHFDKKRNTCFGSFFVIHPKDELFTSIKIKYNNITYILKRKYYYRNSALEIFTSYHKSFYFNFLSQNDRDNFIKDILSSDQTKIFKEIKIESLKKDNLIIGYINSTKKAIPSFSYFSSFEKAINLWKMGEISNFHFLMICNLFSGRSYRDVSQYPIYPWTLKNFLQESKIDKITDLRNYSVPVGMFDFNERSRERKNNYIENYRNMKESTTKDFDLSETPYVYGSHYSNPMYVCHYLSRMFPFSYLSIELQGAKFDNPNRLFISIANSFKLVSEQKCDIRELIPEFFYLSEMYYNINNLDMELKTSDVELPKFAKGKGYNLTRKLRKSIEYNEADIHKWIDLIFGFKQRGKKAEEIYNVFMSYSYDGNVILDNINDDDDLIFRFGLFELGVNPIQIINHPIPQKNLKVKHKFQTINKKFYCLSKMEASSSESGTNINTTLFEPLCYIKIDDKKIFIMYSNFVNYYFKLEDQKVSIFEKIWEKIINEMYILSPTKLFKCPIIMYNKVITAVGGFYGGYILLFDSNKRIDEKIKKFKSPLSSNPIVSLTIDDSFSYGITGDTMGIITVYNVIQTEWTFKLYLVNHISEITCLVINNYLNLLVSAAYDGYINIYTVGKFQHVRSLKLHHLLYATDVYISNCPLPCIIAFNKKSNLMEGFTVNGTDILLCENKSLLERTVTAFCYFKDDFFNDYLVMGTSQGYIIIFSFPLMKLVNIIEVKKNTKIQLLITITNIKLMVILERNEFVILTNSQMAGVPGINKLN